MEDKGVCSAVVACVELHKVERRVQARDETGNGREVRVGFFDAFESIVFDFRFDASKGSPFAALCERGERERERLTEREGVRLLVPWVFV